MNLTCEVCSTGLRSTKSEYSLQKQILLYECEDVLPQINVSLYKCSRGLLSARQINWPSPHIN